MEKHQSLADAETLEGIADRLAGQSAAALRRVAQDLRAAVSCELTR